MQRLLGLIGLALACEGNIRRSQTLRARDLAASDRRSNRSLSRLSSRALTASSTAGNQSKSKFTVCPFGDSLTDGLQGHDDVYVNVGGFRPKLEKELEAEGAELLGFRKCPCHAYPTATSLQLHQQLQKTSYKCGSETGPARYPDVALVLIGTNDLYRQVPVEQSMGQVRTMLSELWQQSPDTDVLIASVPIHPSNPQPFQKYNQAVRNLVIELSQTGKPIEYVPMQEKTNLCTASTCHYDLIHPNKIGYAFMADVWLEAIEPKLHAHKGEKAPRAPAPTRASAYCSTSGLSLVLLAVALAFLNGVGCN